GGVRLTHGSRDTYAVSAPAYREASRRIARMLPERLGEHPALRGCHLHDEYRTLVHGPAAARASRAWLRRRYGSHQEPARPRSAPPPTARRPGASPGCSPSASASIPVCAAGTCTTSTGRSTTALRPLAPSAPGCGAATALSRS